MEEGVWFLPADAGSFAQLVAWQHRIRPLNVSHPIWAALECGGGRHVTPFLCISNNERKRVSPLMWFDFFLAKSKGLSNPVASETVTRGQGGQQALGVPKINSSQKQTQHTSQLDTNTTHHIWQEAFRDPSSEALVVSPLAHNRNWVSYLIHSAPWWSGVRTVRWKEGFTLPCRQTTGFSQGCLWSCFFSHSP